MDELKWTGERLVTQIVDQHGSVEHLHRYALAAQIVENKVVLDIASGEGYGSHLLSYNAKAVYGVDISEEAVTHSKAKYKSANLTFLKGSASGIPLDDAVADVVVSFETIEHLAEHEKMMLEIKRVLKPGGVLLISSPEKDNYRFREKDNPFHIKELYLAEFTALLKDHFTNYKMLTQRFVYGSIISRIDDAGEPAGFSFFDGDYLKVTNSIPDVREAYADTVHNRAYFNIALASDSDLDSITLPDTSFFNAIQIYHNELQKIRNSYSYRIGNRFLRPLSFFKQLMLKFKG